MIMKASQTNGLLWISFIFFKNSFELFLNCSDPNKSIHVIYTLQGVIIIKYVC